MERKIGEIFEHNGDWYQVVDGDSCGECSLRATECWTGTKSDLADEVFGECSKARRSDNKHIIFKKLEKWGEPFSCNYYGDERLVMMQEYQLFDSNVIYCYQTPPMYITDYKHKRIAIEIKQNKEDMGEKKLNLKPFDIQKAREGKPVCTRDGHKARIICFDAKGDKPIIALVEMGTAETPNNYPIDGKAVSTKEASCDLMMLPEKKEGWVNVYNDAPIYDTKERAELGASTVKKRIGTFKIFWEE